jgi:GntR family transcriptional regulator
MAARFLVDAKDPTPLYAQLERTIRAAVATGRLKAGDQLPTVRQLAVDLRVNANTVARVYSELERAGLLETRRGVGTFVIARPSEAHTPRSRKSQLRAFVERVLADAATQGFSARELIEQLEAAHAKGA